MKFTIVMESLDAQQIEILLKTPAELQGFLVAGAIPQNVKGALVKAIQMKTGLDDVETQINDQQKKIADVTAEPARIRENMKTVSADTDYYKRLVKKLDEQETGIEKNQTTIASLKQAFQSQQKQLADYLLGLTVQTVK